MITGMSGRRNFLVIVYVSLVKVQKILILVVSSLIQESEILKKLFDVCEGRFPSEELQKSHFAMKGLRALGMTSYKLRISDLKNRAETVTKLDHEAAIQRSMLLCTYIKHVYSLDSDVSPSKDLQEILDIPFLPVKQKPDGINVPWYGKCKTFESPSQVYSSYSQHLVFSQHPIVNLGFRIPMRL